MAEQAPPYARIVAEIRRRIADGELRAGDRVPSTRQIMQEWGVAMATASKVLAALRQERLVHTRPGAGTVVAATGTGAEPEPRPAGSRRRRTREPEQELTVGRIVQAAVEIADAEGLTALSLRRVATELDVATMTLYRHVAGKDELVLLMAEEVFAEDPLPDPPPPGWRARLELIARLQWAIHRRHPWLVQVMSLTRPKPAPKAMAHTEWALRAVAGLGLDPVTMLYVHIATFGYVRGMAVNFELEAQAEQETGITDEQWMQAQGSALTTMLSSGAFPLLASVVTRRDLDLDLDTMFEFGLSCVLDGIGVLIERRAR